MRRKHIVNTFARKAEKKWDTLYWAVDIHDTCIKANYKAGDIPTEFFPKAKEALLKIGNRKDCCLILFTCSHPHEIDKYLYYFKGHGINFKHVNKNPEAENTAFGFFEHKFYTNFILDDKAGFDPKEDWDMILNAMEEVEYIETTTPEEREKHKKTESRMGVYACLSLVVSIILGGLAGVFVNNITGHEFAGVMTATAVISILFTSVMLYVMGLSLKAPYKFHTEAFKNKYR